jgi:hypothetical protein
MPMRRSCYISIHFWLCNSAFVAQVNLQRHVKTAQGAQPWHGLCDLVLSKGDSLMPAPFNLREWPLFRVARNVVIDDDVPPPQRVPEPASLGITDLDRSAAEEQEDIDTANELALLEQLDQENRERELDW